MKTCTHVSGHRFDVDSVGSPDRSVNRLTCTRRGCGAVKWNGCAIMRTHEVRVGLTLSMFGTGGIDESNARTEIRTELCATPLFGETEQDLGVCKSCATGREVDGNRFASPEARARAQGSGYVTLDNETLRESDVLAMIETSDPDGMIAKLLQRSKASAKGPAGVVARSAAISALAETWNSRGPR